MYRMIEQQIKLEKAMTECSIQKFRSEFTKVKQNENLSSSQSINIILKNIIENYTQSIKQYIEDYSTGKAIRSTLAANIIKQLPYDVVAFVTSRIIFNKIYTKSAIQSVYKAIGQALEDEWKMRSYKRENNYYYDKIQSDLNSRGAKANRKKYITMGVFNKRLDFQLDKWSITEKVQAGLILINLFIETTGLVTLEDVYKKKKHIKILAATKELEDAITNLNNKLECMQPLFLPMVCRPKEWTSVLEGGYISPYIRKNKLIKNNDKKYLKKLNDIDIPLVYEA